MPERHEIIRSLEETMAWLERSPEEQHLSEFEIRHMTFDPVGLEILAGEAGQQFLRVGSGHVDSCSECRHKQATQAY